MIKLYNGDCLDVMDKLIEAGVKVDAIITDPPYDIKNTNPGGNSMLSKSMVNYNKEILEQNLSKGFDYTRVLDKFCKLQDKINVYIWCNKAQIPVYLDYFVAKKKCSFDIIKWVKTNPIPTFHNKYISDTEYCLYFRKGGFCKPANFEDGSTLFMHPLNVKDKKKYKHPTIKPIEIIEKIIRNSSKENRVILDPFMGSGTTGVACVNLNRKFIGMELDKDYFEIAKNRIKEAIDNKN